MSDHEEIIPAVIFSIRKKTRFPFGSAQGPVNLMNEELFGSIPLKETKEGRELFFTKCFRPFTKLLKSKSIIVLTINMPAGILSAFFWP